MAGHQRKQQTETILVTLRQDCEAPEGLVMALLPTECEKEFLAAVFQEK
jgi:hypothetical protein